jgi:hypothetical protein
MVGIGEHIKFDNDRLLLLMLMGLYSNFALVPLEGFFLYLQAIRFCMQRKHSGSASSHYEEQNESDTPLQIAKRELGTELQNDIPSPCGACNSHIRSVIFCEAFRY